jgi:hypothetical protein
LRPRKKSPKKYIIAAGVVLVVVSLYVFRDETPDIFQDDQVYHYLGENNSEENAPQAILDEVIQKVECYPMPSDPPLELFRSLTDSSEEKNDLDEAINEVIEGELNQTTNNKSQMGRFYEAQRLAVAENGAHLADAIKIMSELKTEDPSNGAYPYFQASLKSRAGYPPAEVREELFKAMMVPNFDTHFKTMTTRILEKGMKDVPSYMAAVELNSKLPSPDYSDSADLIKIFAKKTDPEFSELALNFGKRLMDDGYLRNTKPEGAGWLATEFETGKTIVKATWGEVYEGTEIPPRYTESYKKLIETYNASFPAFQKTDCPSDSYKHAFEILKGQPGTKSEAISD